MPLDKELKGASGKDMGKEVARVAQDQDEAVESSKLGMMDETPVCLCLLSWEEGEMVIGLRHLFTELPRILDHRRVANLDSPCS